MSASTSLLPTSLTCRMRSMAARQGVRRQNGCSVGLSTSHRRLARARVAGSLLTPSARPPPRAWIFPSTFPRSQSDERARSDIKAEFLIRRASVMARRILVSMDSAVKFTKQPHDGHCACCPSRTWTTLCENRDRHRVQVILIFSTMPVLVP